MCYKNDCMQEKGVQGQKTIVLVYFYHLQRYRTPFENYHLDIQYSNITHQDRFVQVFLCNFNFNDKKLDY